MTFSVVIPLYNKKNALSRTLASIMMQSYKDYEVIIVDDGSSDGSADVAEQFIKQHELEFGWRIIKKANGGVSSARNLGVQNAKSEFIAFMDADDLWDANYLQHQSQMIVDFPQASMWGTAWGYFVDNKKKSIEHVPADYKGYISDYWSIPKPTNIFCVNSTIYRKQSLLDAGGFDEHLTLGEDLDLNYRILFVSTAAYDSHFTGFYYVTDAENRAMNRIHPIENTLPFHAAKFASYKNENAAFARFIDRIVVGILKPYLVLGINEEECSQILKSVDKRNLKFMQRLLLLCPKLYKQIVKLYHV